MQLSNWHTASPAAGSNNGTLKVVLICMQRDLQNKKAELLICMGMKACVLRRRIGCTPHSFRQQLEAGA